MKLRASAIMVASAAKLPRKEMASYGCPVCKNVTVVQASMEKPFCCHCGADSLKAREQANVSGAKLIRATDAELANVKCPGCASHLIMTVDTAVSHVTDKRVGHINCPACATDIAFKSPRSTAATDSTNADDEDWLADQPTGIDDMGVGDESETDDTDPELTEDQGERASVIRRGRGRIVERADESDENPESDDEQVEEQPGTESPMDTQEAEGNDPTDTDTPEDDTSEVDNDPEAESEDACTMTDKEKAAVSGAGSIPVQSVPPMIGKKPVKLSLYHICPEKPVFAVVGDTQLACIQGEITTAVRPIAAGENAKALASALTHASTTNNLGALLKQNNFKTFEVTASVKSVVDQEVSKRKAEVASVSEADHKALTSRVHQSLAIALCGLNRGFFKYSNPMVASLTKAIATLGVSQDEADVLVTDALNESGDDLADVLRDLTMELVGKSDETRDELASTIVKVQRRPNANTAVAAVTGASAFERELVKPMRRSNAKTQHADTPEVAAVGSTRVAQLAAKSGPLHATFTLEKKS